MECVLGRMLWESTDCETILPPTFRKMPGRPKKLRRKDKEEIKKSGKLSRKRRKMHSRICGVEGHNAKGCNKRPKDLQVSNIRKGIFNEASQSMTDASTQSSVATRTNSKV